MKTATGLFVIAVGAVFAFAVHGHPWFLNLQVVGWILMVLGVVGLVLPRRSVGWLRRQMVVKRSPDGQPLAWSQQRPSNPQYMVLNPGATAEGTARDFDRREVSGTPVAPVPPEAVSSEEVVPEEEVVEEYFPE
jgi:Domain of unknown function (DUF6458)